MNSGGDHEEYIIVVDMTTLLADELLQPNISQKRTRNHHYVGKDIRYPVRNNSAQDNKNECGYL